MLGCMHGRVLGLLQLMRHVLVLYSLVGAAVVAAACVETSPHMQGLFVSAAAALLIADQRPRYHTLKQLMDLKRCQVFLQQKPQKPLLQHTGHRDKTADNWCEACAAAPTLDGRKATGHACASELHNCLGHAT